MEGGTITSITFPVPNIGSSTRFLPAEMVPKGVFAIVLGSLYLILKRKGGPVQLPYRKKKKKLSGRLYRVPGPALAFLVTFTHSSLCLILFLLKVYDQIFVAFLSQKKIVLFNSFHPTNWSHPRISSLIILKLKLSELLFYLFIYLFFFLAGSTMLCLY